MRAKTTNHYKLKSIVMDFYEVLEKRRTYRDFSDREVSYEIMERVIGAAFKAPTSGCPVAFQIKVLLHR